MKRFILLMHALRTGAEYDTDKESLRNSVEYWMKVRKF